MILAFDTITLAQVSGVQGIYRFYQMGAEAPTKPTSYPPAEPWSQTEPEYDLNSDEVLYYIDCTLFSDLSYQYGEVQVSSEYGAAKSAYQEAIAQIDEAEKRINITQAETQDSILSAVSEEYYSKDDFDTKLGEISTSLEQTKNAFEMQFSTIQANVDNINASTNDQFTQLYQYIRFSGGAIELGEQGNAITLTIENDRISFKQSGQEVAYISNNKLHITDAEIDHSLTIGNFIFSPRPDESLDFKKRGANN